MEINTFPDHPFASYFSGNTVQLCPVGALTSTAYRFKARPWDLQQVESTCTGCSVGCRIVIDSSRDEVLRYHGVDSDPVNWSWLCDKGRYGFEALNSPDRVVEPLARRDTNSDLTPVRWNDALGLAARAVKDGLERSGPEGIAVLGGARLTNEAAFVWSKLAKGIIGTDNVDAQMGDGLPAELVLGLPKATIDETCTPGGTILVLAPDVKEELGVLFLRLRHASVFDGAKIIELSATETGLSYLTEASLRVRPGEAAGVLAALFSVVGAPDGVDPLVFESARILLQAEGPLHVVLGRASMAESDDVVTASAHQILAARPEATFLTTLRRANVHGALDMGLAPGMLPGRVSLDEGRTSVAAGWGVAANELPKHRGLDAAGILDAAANGKIDTLILLGADPIADFTDRALATRALGAVRSVISVDMFLNESNRNADVVLPVAGFASDDGTTTNLEGRVTRVAQRVTAPGSSHSDWVIGAELAQHLGSDLKLETVEEIRSEIARTAGTHAAMTDELLDANPDGLVFPIHSDLPATPPATDDVAAKEPEPTQESEVQAGPGEDDEAAAADAPVVESAPDPVSAVSLPAAPTLQIPVRDAYSYRLVITRKMYDHGTLVQHAPHLAPLAIEAGQAPARLNPADLEQLGVSPGQRLKVSSAQASLTAEVVADAGVPRGTIAFVFDQSAGGAQQLLVAGSLVTDVRVETQS